MTVTWTGKAGKEWRREPSHISSCPIDNEGSQGFTNIAMSSFLEVQIREGVSYNIYFSFPKYSRNWTFLSVNAPKRSASDGGRTRHGHSHSSCMRGSFLKNEIRIALCFWSHIFFFIPIRSCVKGDALSFPIHTSPSSKYWFSCLKCECNLVLFNTTINARKHWIWKD